MLFTVSLPLLASFCSCYVIEGMLVSSTAMIFVSVHICIIFGYVVAEWLKAGTSNSFGIVRS